MQPGKILLLWVAFDYSEATAARRQPCYKLMHEARVQGDKAFYYTPLS